MEWVQFQQTIYVINEILQGKLSKSPASKQPNSEIQWILKFQNTSGGLDTTLLRNPLKGLVPTTALQDTLAW